MSKPPSKTAPEILDQVNKAREALAYFEPRALDSKGEFSDGATVRARLNAAKAHIIRAIEKAQGV